MNKGQINLFSNTILEEEENFQYLQEKMREHRRVVALAKPLLPAVDSEGKYTVIYADPPWQFVHTIKGHWERPGVAEDIYPTMPLKDICALKIPETEKSATLFLWATSPMLDQAFEVIRAWAFTYKASFIWDKIKHNMGKYNSVRHEVLLIAGRGRSRPQVRGLSLDSVISLPRTTHSTKPEFFRELIDTLYPTGRRIELFARGVLPLGWDGWGNEYRVSAGAAGEEQTTS